MLYSAVSEEDKLNEQDSASLGRMISEQEVINWLKSSASAKVPGLDGIPYEFWEAMVLQHNLPQKGGREEKCFNIITLLQTVFNNIETYGVVDEKPVMEQCAGMLNV